MATKARTARKKAVKPVDLKEIAAAFDPLARVYRINEPLNIPDDSPLRMAIPGAWPTWGEFKRLYNAISAVTPAHKGKP